MYRVFLSVSSTECIKGVLSDLRQFFATEIPLKIMKYVFYCTLKDLFVLKIFKFCLSVLDIYENSLIRKKRLISKFMTSQVGKQTIAIYILPNISRSKGNQTMKSGQLIKYNMRKIFLQNSYTKCGVETIPRRFSKKLNLNISLDEKSSFMQFIFIVCQVEGY